ncbi:MAG: hemerythrin domain-containing protein [Pseudomonadota bacterium]
MNQTTRDDPAYTDALQMLKDDHAKVKKIFDQFEKERDTAGLEDKRLLVKRACQELSIHAQLEEEIFYPAMRESVDADDALDEAEVEHGSIKELVTDLEFMEPDDALYDAKFKVLAEYVTHHVSEEEGEIFPAAKRAKVDLKQLASELSERKEQLVAIFGIQDDEQDILSAVTARRSSGGDTGSSKSH